ncbi:MAG: hypothetical protein VR72_20260 [Clostridiaceae bacterium BRH_c20a]|nr:MAG: hypothetical protein VR72_20260 [Clostridiaceae bacterium BRH_c20a]
METLVIGTGNEVYGDDSIGIHILRKLQRLALPKRITLLSIGTDPFILMGQDLNRYQRIIVVDGIKLDRYKAKIYFSPAEELKPRPRPYSIHDITWCEVLKMEGVLAKTWLFSVETKTLQTGIELSPALQENLEYYAAKLHVLLMGYTVC